MTGDVVVVTFGERERLRWAGVSAAAIDIDSRQTELVPVTRSKSLEPCRGRCRLQLITATVTVTADTGDDDDDLSNQSGHRGTLKAFY